MEKGGMPMVLQQPLQHTASDIFNEIRDLHFQRNRLLDLKKQGIVNGVDVVIQELTKKELKLKEQKVLEVHTYAITETTVKKRGQDVKRWQTKCGDTRPRCSTYEALIDKLYDYYFGASVITDYSFKTMFEAALDEKIRTERPKEKTIRDYHNSYKAFISDEFGAKDIRLIKPSELKEYIQNVSGELAPTKKRFYKFKGILNLVFDYACDPERRYIEINPVPSKNKAYAKNFTPTNDKPEDKAFQPHEVDMIRKHLWERVHRLRYDVNGYAILFSSETGVREGEIPSLNKELVSEEEKNKVVPDTNIFGKPKQISVTPEEYRRWQASAETRENNERMQKYLKEQQALLDIREKSLNKQGRDLADRHLMIESEVSQRVEEGIKEKLPSTIKQLQYELKIEQKQLDKQRIALNLRGTKLDKIAEVKKSVAAIIKDTFRDFFQKFKDSFLKHFKGKHQKDVLEVIKDMPIDEETADRLFKYGFYDAERHTIGEILERALEEDIKDALHEAGASYKQIKMDDIEAVKQSIDSGASLDEIASNMSANIASRMVSLRHK